MGERIVLGNTHIEVADQDFSTGYQEGYVRFLGYYQGNPLTDRGVSDFLARNIYDTRTTDRYRAGYIVGWCAALHGQGCPEPTVGFSTKDAHQQRQVTA